MYWSIIEVFTFYYAFLWLIVEIFKERHFYLISSLFLTFEGFVYFCNTHLNQKKKQKQKHKSKTMETQNLMSNCLMSQV